MTTELVNTQKKVVPLKKLLTKKFLKQMREKIPNIRFKNVDEVLQLEHKYTKWGVEHINTYRPSFVDEIVHNRVPHYVINFIDIDTEETAQIILSIETHNIVKETFNKKSFPYSKEDVIAREKGRMKKFWSNEEYKAKHNSKRQGKTISSNQDKLKLNQALLNRYQAVLKLTTNEQSRAKIQEVIDKLQKNIEHCNSYLEEVKKK